MLRFFARGEATGRRAPARSPAFLRALGLWAAATVFSAGAAHATLVVSQAVSTSTIAVGDRTRLTITLNNSDVQEDNASLINTLPAQLRFYPVGHPGRVVPTSTCAGATITLGTGPGGVDQLRVTGFTIPPHVGGVDGSCTISLDLTSYDGGDIWDNVINAGDLTPAAVSAATQSVSVTELKNPTVAKDLGDATLTQGLSR